MSQTDLTMRLFGGFDLRDGQSIIEVPVSLHRVLAFLALHDRRLPRCYVADTLWPDTGEEKAHANLRTALWRLHRLHCDIVYATPMELALDPAVRVDARTLHEAARNYRRTGTLPDPDTLLELRGELLPGCWDCWLVFERERLRYEAVELLESTSRACLAKGEMHLAAMLGLCAVECDPLRESAHQLVVRVSLAAGDRIVASRHARRYADLLKTELGLPPPPMVSDLLRMCPKQDISTS
ncbi:MULTISPECIES: AfsR/SARP family transcriptional regulator [Rhodococcus]|uniref:SARP family transcriptional regulator n=1 Tax=Rhodococcus opacus RKJ300 = JCM 13270 TaxID=1165867 RepID=I0WDM7_RHOOP|nr:MULTISPECIES: BTAD domain-containing putative transcriptional regulator [Rhodococcus]EID74493.1 SARP family transcriptional regulator [Rhodococcus opacus RKJ300 = JCM 13270]QQZ18459.1 SARP family transcriptional regulator [Rhodococcus sp. 21391]